MRGGRGAGAPARTHELSFREELRCLQCVRHGAGGKEGRGEDLQLCAVAVPLRAGLVLYEAAAILWKARIDENWRLLLEKVCGEWGLRRPLDWPEAGSDRA